MVLIAFGAAMPGGPVAPATAAASSPVTDWPMYLHDGSLSAASTETILSPAAAPNLRPLWTYKTGGVISASATVVGGVAYVGSWDGYEYALNASTGALIWKTYLGITTAPACSPPALGVSSVAAVVGGVVYVGGGDSNWYALDATTGSVLWSVPTGDNSATGGHYNWSSPLIVGNSAYIGIASLGDCPLVQGQLLRVDLTTHAVAASVNFVPTGQVGGGIWTTPAIDTTTNTVYVTTGTRNAASQTNSEAMVAVDATTLAIKGYWQIPLSAANSDSDWGTSPILFNDGNNRPIVAGINKNGFLYAFDRTNLALGPIWSEQVAVGGICPTCGDASVASMAFAQGLLFEAGGNTTINGIGYAGAIRAIDPTTGAVVWAHGLADPVIPALAYDNGMVFAGSGPRLEVFDAASGSRLGSYSTGAVTYSPPTISNGTVFMGSGNGTMYAFAPVAPVAPPADPNCPISLVCQDIGSPTPAGSEVVSSGSWAISAGGAGIGLAAGADQFRFMSQAVNGDLGITARVAAETVAGTGTQAGVMVRQANDPGSPFYSVTYAGGTTLQVQYRKAFGAATTSIKVAAAGVPQYLQIQRIGDRFTASTSPDGVTYTLIPGSSASVTMPTTVMAGLAAASGVGGTATASTIDSVVVGAPGTPPSPPAPPSPCPSGWSCGDVGSPAAVGDQSLSSGTWTIKGAGTTSGINVYADQFHFIWQPLAGDGTLSARIATQPNTAAGAQAGVEFRGNATDPGAVFYGAFVTPSNGISIVYRASAGLRTIVLATAAGVAPQYLEITRYQGTFTTFTSTDGVTWNGLIGSSITLGGSGAMVAGLTVNSGSTGTLVTDTFDSVSLAASAAPPPSLCPSGWTCQDVGNPTPLAGSQFVVAPNWTVQAGGSDIWGTYDAFRLLSQPLAGDGTVSVRVDTQSNSSTWAKAGVMIRATNDPSSPYFAAFVTPGNGVVAQWRSTQGGSTGQVATTGIAPQWLQVSRAGSTYTAYTSADGTTWTAIPGSSVSLTMTGTLLAGLAVTSHNGGAMSTVTFDTVTLTNAAPPPPSCPSGWTCADIGSVGVAGGQSLTAGTWTVQGGGGDIWDVADNFHYVSQSLTTDGGVSARAIAQTNTSVWAKAGVMMRATIDPGSPYYAAFVTPGNGVAVQWRTAQGGTSSQVLLAATTPVYIRVARAGGSYSAYSSPDGSTWTLVPGSTVNLGLTGTVLAGLAVTSHSWGILSSATFDTVLFQSMPLPWLDTDIGSPALVGSASSTSGVFSVNAGGADIYGTADQLHYAYQSTTGNTTFSARVTGQANTSSWAKSGLMLRATTDPGSPNYFAFVTPGNGVAVQWRKTQGGSTSQVKAAGTVPVYLEIVRSGNTFTSYTSADGATWTAIPGSSVTFTMPATVLAGLATTSHNTSKTGTATFDTISFGAPPPPPPPPPSDFSISASPASVSVVAGNAATTSISTALVSGSAETVTLSPSGAPAGVTAGFSPGSVTAGGASTLTLTVGASTVPGTYPITVTGTAPSTTHSTTVTLTVTAPPPPGLPSPWVDTDVGAPAIAGSAAYASGVFTVNGNGVDIFGTSDQFNYVYQPTTGNGTIIARVTSVSNTSSNAKAGVIWKASTTAGSPYILIAAAPSGLIKVQYNFNGSISTSTYTYPNAWMKLVRSGTSFSAYLSPDGVTWTAVLTNKTLSTIPTAATVGIFECSHNATKLGTATFDNVTFTPGP
jgi:outer membrane protein assembly factor BamB